MSFSMMSVYSILVLGIQSVISYISLCLVNEMHSLAFNGKFTVSCSREFRRATKKYDRFYLICACIALFILNQAMFSFVNNAYRKTVVFDFCKRSNIDCDMDIMGFTFSSMTN